MGLSIYDSANQHYIVTNNLVDMDINQLLVTERRDKFSFPFGDAEIVQLAFSGICIAYGDVLAKESKLRVKSFDEPELVELHFTLSGNGILENFITNRKISVRANQHNIIYTPDFDGLAEITTDQHFKFFEIHFERQRFVDLTGESSTLLKTFADNIMNNRSVQISSENLPISLAMHSCINDIMNCSFTGGLKLLFLQSKCIELLAMQAQAFETASKQPKKTSIKSDYDQDRIYYAREYLLQHADCPPSLTELAKVAGINEFKLKQGFKEVFKNTVFGYLSDYKLLQAKTLLTEGTMPIKNIADELGYSSVQHFSTAFKKKFGISPAQSKR